MNINKKTVGASLLAIGLTVGASGYAGAEEQPPAEVVEHSDPLESINRPIWDFNYKVLDKHVLRRLRSSIATMCRIRQDRDLQLCQQPRGAVIGCHNLLQGKFAYAANATGRSGELDPGDLRTL